MKCVGLVVVISLWAEHTGSAAGTKDDTACASKLSQAAACPTNGRSYLQSLRRLSSATAPPQGDRLDTKEAEAARLTEIGTPDRHENRKSDSNIIAAQVSSKTSPLLKLYDKCPHGGRWETVTCKSLGWNVSTHNRKIYDGFAYNGEVDMFWARKRELEHIVDGTAILVTETNFRGDSHTLAAIPSDDVKHVVLPASAFDECREKGRVNPKCAVSLAKNSVANALELFNLSLEDWIIFGDVDEIPNREFVRLLKECDVPVGHKALHLSAISHFMYDTGCKVKSSNWLNRKNVRTPVVMKVPTMRKYGLRLHQAFAQPDCTKNGPHATCLDRLVPETDAQKEMWHWYMDDLSGYMPCAMWHLSGLGGMELLQRKLSDNADRANGSQFARMARECKEVNPDRPGMHMARKNKSATKYPEIPHSVAEDPQRFSLFTTSPL